MITFKKFGKHGNLGNQLHQIASLIGFSEKYNCELILPEWNYAAYFENFPQQGFIDTDVLIEEPFYHYTPQFWDSHREKLKTQNADILGWLQSEKYWQHCKEKVHQALSFKKNFLHETKSKFAEAFRKKTIAISIRRGDFVTNPNHFLLPVEFYLGALIKFFSDHTNYSIIIFSDDLHFCKTEIRALPHIYFAAGLSAIEQLCLMSLCDHFIISNSTFSWWGAMLGEKKDSIIIRSPYYADGELKEKIDFKDYYPERWITYDHVVENIDLRALRQSPLARFMNRNKTFYKYLRRPVISKLKPFYKSV
jgi:hypothetical protein